MQSIFREKLVPVALVAALLGGLVGALGVGPTVNGVNAAFGGNNSDLAARVEALDTPEVDEVFNIEDEPAPVVTTQGIIPANAPQAQTPALAYAGQPAPVVRQYETVRYASAPRAARTRRAVGYSESRERQPVYNAPQPRKRSFWSKHRDKLTVAVGTGAGAAVGGLIGGKKGALIGGLAGAGGSALYTYKIRNRAPRY
jgi:hypothetical protein